MRIIVSGGGTGGHISPVLAVVSELKKLDKDAEILYIGSFDGLEGKIVPQTGIEYREISSGKFRRYHKNAILNIIDITTLFKNIADLFRFFRGILEASKIIKEFDPDIIFTKGGYVSLPVGMAARFAGYPYVIHESDSIMGLSNKLLSKKAAKVCVSYPVKYYKEIDQEKLVYTGNPVREDISEGSKDLGLKEFNIKKELPVLMVIGGSQGALAINQLVSESLTKLLKDFQIIHVSGERDYDWLNFQSEKLADDVKENYHLYNFLSGNLKDAYAVSDLIISRAGNNVLAELAMLGKPAILIPISFSANNHQLENARIISRAGGALLMLQEHLTAEKLVRQINLLFEEPEELKSMSEKIKSFAKEDAAKLVADTILREGEISEEIEGGEEDGKDTPKA